VHLLLGRAAIVCITKLTPTAKRTLTYFTRKRGTPGSEAILRVYLQSTTIRVNILLRAMANEELIQKAINAYSNSTEKSLSAAARAYGQCPSTVTHRFSGRTTRQKAHENSQLLLEAQEIQLVRWINELEIWGFPLRLDLLRDMASSLAGKPCGKNWPNRFMKRHNLTTIYSRQLDCNRAWNNDPIIISE
jgi:hypothetical protein